MFRSFLAALAFLFASQAASSQHSLLYEVSGNGLKKPSYLFGTFHFLTQSFVDSQKVVMKKLKKSKAVAGEVVIDSMTAASVNMMSALVTDTPLDKLLSTQAYVELNAMTTELLGMDLTFLKNMPPTVVNVMLLQRIYIQNFQPPAGEQAMDIYFQEYAQKKKKKIIGLESVQTQVKALFNRPLKQQAEQLEEFVLEKDSLVPQLRATLEHYRNANYDALVKMMYEDEGFTPEEIKTLLTDRNDAWLKQLPTIMKEQPTFVAVGAMHLAGNDGLVTGLRKLGYNVTPLNTR